MNTLPQPPTRTKEKTASQTGAKRTRKHFVHTASLRLRSHAHGTHKLVAFMTSHTHTHAPREIGAHVAAQLPPAPTLLSYTQTVV